MKSKNRERKTGTNEKKWIFTYALNFSINYVDSSYRRYGWPTLVAFKNMIRSILVFMVVILFNELICMCCVLESLRYYKIQTEEDF